MHAHRCGVIVRWGSPRAPRAPRQGKRRARRGPWGARVTMVLAGLSLIRLLRESDRGPFLDVVVELLCGEYPAADLDARFGLPFAEAGSEPATLLVAAKALLGALSIDLDGHATLAARLQTAGVEAPLADWLCSYGAAAVQPRQAALRRAQAHAAAQAHQNYLTDFDWQLQYVLSSSTIASLREPLVLLLLRMQAPGAPPTEQQVELSAKDLDAALSALDQASGAVTAMRQPKQAK